MTPQGVKIGRADSCEIQVSDTSAELFHCIVKLVGGKPTVLNLASDNGVDVNGTSVNEAELASNDTIRIGNARFSLLASDGEKGVSRAPKIIPVAFLLGIAVVGTYFYRQYKIRTEHDGVAAPVVANSPDDAIMTNRVVRMVTEEIVKTNRVIHVVDNVVITNYVAEVRRGGALVSSTVVSSIDESKSRDGELTAGATPDNSTEKTGAPLMPAEELPPYEVIDSKKALAMGGASGGDEVRMVVNTNGTCDIIHIFTNTAVTSTLVVPGKNRIVSKSASFLVVAGGGAAGRYYGGGGGAGDVVMKEARSLSPGTAYVYVGAGGNADGIKAGRNGEDSILTIGGVTYTAIGGGAAGGYSGGSGGGGYGNHDDRRRKGLQPKSISGGTGYNARNNRHGDSGGGPGVLLSISGKCEAYAFGGLFRGRKPENPELYNAMYETSYGSGTDRSRGSYVSAKNGIVIVRYAVKASKIDAVSCIAYPEFPSPDKGVSSRRIDGFDWRYFVEKDGSVTIGCHGEESHSHPDIWIPAVDTKVLQGVVRIPNRIDGKPVKKIGKGAFQGCAKVTDFVVPEGVVRCEARAFAKCAALKSVTYPRSLEWLGEGQIYRSPNVEALNFQSVPPDCDYGCCPLKGSVFTASLSAPFAIIGKWRNCGDRYLCWDGCHDPRCITRPSKEEEELARRTCSGFIGGKFKWPKHDDLKTRQESLVKCIETVWRNYDSLSRQMVLSLPCLYLHSAENRTEWRDYVNNNSAILGDTAVIYVSRMFFKAHEPVSFKYNIDDSAMIMIDDETAVDFSLEDSWRWTKEYSSTTPIEFGEDGWHSVAIIAANEGGAGGATFFPRQVPALGGVFYKRGDGEWRMFEAKPDGSEFRVTKEDARRAVADIERAKRRQK